MIKQVLITGITAVGLLLSAQATAHNQGGQGTFWNNSAHGHGHNGHAQPQRRKFRVNREQREQAGMIRQGIRTCQITPREADRLNKQQNKINRAERRMRRGDGLQRWERQQLKQRLHNARVQINRLTKNRKTCNRHRGHNNHNGGHRNNHSSWNFSNGHGSFSINVGH